MDDPVILWGLAVVAAAAALFPAFRLVVVDVNVQLATRALRKLLDAGNRSRAIKLTAAAPRSVYMRAVRRALEAPDGADADEVASRDTMQRRFDGELFEGMRPLRRMAPVTYLALVAGGLGAGLAVTASSPLWPPAIAAAVAALLGLRNLKQVDALERRSRDGFAELLAPAAAAADLGVANEPAPERTASPAPAAAGGALALVATIDGREIARVTLDEAVIKIGRMASSQLCLDDESVSRMHAVVEVADDGGAQIIDLGSARGTVLNGERINKATLAAGDVLELGDVRVEVVP